MQTNHDNIGIYRIRMRGWHVKFIKENARFPRQPPCPDRSAHTARKRSFRPRRRKRQRQIWNKKGWQFKPCAHQILCHRVYILCPRSSPKEWQKVDRESKVPWSGLNSIRGLRWYCFTFNVAEWKNYKKWSPVKESTPFCGTSSCWLLPTIPWIRV